MARNNDIASSLRFSIIILSQKYFYLVTFFFFKFLWIWYYSSNIRISGRLSARAISCFPIRRGISDIHILGLVLRQPRKAPRVAWDNDLDLVIYTFSRFQGLNSLISWSSCIAYNSSALTIWLRNFGGPHL